MRDFLRVSPDAVPPRHDRPDPGKVISGSPRFTTWSIEDRDGLFCGIWKATPGKWRIAYDEWEYCRILSGRSVITDAATGHSHLVAAGDSFVIRPGFRGTWEVVETTRKDYVILLQPPEGGTGTDSGTGTGSGTGSGATGATSVAP